MADQSNTDRETSKEIAALNQRIRELEEARAEEKGANESELLVRAISMAAQDAIVMLDVEGRVSYWNLAADRIFGYTSNEALGRNLHDMLAPKRYHEAHDAAFPEFQCSGRGNAVGKTLQLKALRKSGQEFPIELSLSSVRFKDGWHAVGIIRDISEREQAEEELFRQKVRFQSLFTNTNDAMVFIDEKHKIIDINYQFTRLFGYDLDEIKGRVINKVVDPHGMADNIYASPRFLRGEKVEMEAVRYGKDGQPIDVLLKGAPVFIKGKIAGGYAIYSDMREKKRAEKLLLESKSRFEAIVSSLGDAVFLIDPATRLIDECNNAATTIFGYSREELVGRQSSILHIDQAHFEQFGIDAMASYEDPGYHATEFLMRRRDGSVFPTENYVRPVRDSDGRILYVVSVVRDISERKQAEEKIHQMAHYDSLTGLPNRELLSDRLAVALAHARRNHGYVAVAMLDLDNFKDVNDKLGHDIGDLLLKAAAERLSAALRESDTVARFGGDEFVLLLPGLKKVDDVTPVARKIVESFRKFFLIGAHQLLVTTSIGIAVYPDDGTEEKILIKNADSAMYQAKQTGRNRYQIYVK
ncbi:MAG TPA: sensor domain-containing diguanylate cyclase [Desulfobacteraceae bacterium]|nr:sensor domain-containing diguanylate cyclase [Desulfobacteraceae bacterium]